MDVSSLTPTVPCLWTAFIFSRYWAFIYSCLLMICIGFVMSYQAKNLPGGDGLERQLKWSCLCKAAEKKNRVRGKETPRNGLFHPSPFGYRILQGLLELCLSFPILGLSRFRMEQEAETVLGKCVNTTFRTSCSSGALQSLYLQPLMWQVT